MKTTPIIIYLLFLTFTAFAQVKFTPYQERLKSGEQRTQLEEASIISELEFKNIGPTVMSGRVVDLDVNPQDPSHFYVAYASGGLWKTTSNGTAFSPMFQHETTMTIGDIAVDWENNETIWVGTGENNSSRSSYAGSGIYKSTDKGKTWQYLGLAETHHIGRIILHPSDPNTVWVAALGHLYSPNKERGIYKTSNGGKNWKKVHYVNEDAGFVDLIIHPKNPDVLYAASWERERSAWDFKGAGNGSNIYKSTDGGENWEKLNTKGSGFPDNEGVGRIGLDISQSDPNIVYAVLDNQNRRPKTDEETLVVNKSMLEKISKEDFLQLSDQEINAYLDKYNFPRQYNAADIKSAVETGEIKPNALVEYLADANADLFDTPVIGLEIYRSKDAGNTWEKMNEQYIDGVYYSYGYYFGQVRVSPKNPNELYTFGVPVIKSEDSGKTWKSINGGNVHVDHHALWVNPNREGHLILGNDGGVNISYDDGETWFKCNSLPVGQFYAINVDMAKPYNVYGGLQDNGVWYGAYNTEINDDWQMEGAYPYKELLGGDGMQVQIDTRDNNTIYTGFQFGYYFRVDKTTGRRKLIQPKHELGERPLRFNWQTPIHLSIHNQDILYLGSNKFHRSLNRGDDFVALSGDLTKGGKKGNVPYGTLTDINESPLKFGLIYAGTDDGLIHISKDGGYNWEKISQGLPPDMWVSRVTASAFKESRVYASLNGYRFDNFEPMVYASEDYGKTWKAIGKNLPNEPVNVIIEDTENENILYVGTDHGLYISLNQGESFMSVGESLPDVAVHDLVIQPREKHLIVGTHGRSLYLADIERLQKLTPQILEKDLHVFEIENVKFNNNWGNSGSYTWSDFNEAALDVFFFSVSGELNMSIKNEKDIEVYEHKKSVGKGLQKYTYNLTLAQDKVEAYKKSLSDKNDTFKKKDNGEYYLQPGDYTVQLKINGSDTVETSFKIIPPKDKPERKAVSRTP